MPKPLDTQENSSLMEIVKSLRDDTITLFRQEVALAKKEVGEKASAIGRNAVFLAVGGVIGIFALLFILLGASHLIAAVLRAAGLSPGTAAWLGPVILGLVLGAAALFLMLKAMRILKKSPVPEKTLDSVREDRDWIKGKMP